MQKAMALVNKQLRKEKQSLSSLSRQIEVPYSTLHRWAAADKPLVARPNQDNLKRVLGHFGYNLVPKKVGTGMKLVKKAA